MAAKAPVVARKFYYMRDIRRMFGITMNSVRVKLGKDNDFPRPRKILNRLTWLVTEVDKWFEDQASKPTIYNYDAEDDAAGDPEEVK